MDSPVVSVLIVTYNHERFISQAIEGVLQQKTNFPIEIVIGEDFSSDNTREICVGYHFRNPEKIKLVLPDSNLGMMRNFIQTANFCRGMYIALCDGDDFWIDPLKLQKQFDLMQSNLELSMCYHPGKLLKEETQEFFKTTSLNDKPISTFDDILESGWYILTASMFFRRLDFPKEFSKLRTGDYPLHLMLASKGNIGFLPEVMSVYRIHKGGNTLTLIPHFDMQKKRKRLCEKLEVMTFIDEYSEGKRSSQIRKQRIRLLERHIRTSLRIRFHYLFSESAYVFFKYREDVFSIELISMMISRFRRLIFKINIKSE